MPRILALDTYDVRFPTSRTLAGSDAMNLAPDYAAAYAVLRTDGPDELAGHGFTFTTGRFNDVQVAAIAALAPAVVGTDVDELVGDLGGFSRRLVRDSQLRWLGPETANPLYLPQAKVYDRSCGIGPCLVPVSLAPPWQQIRIELRIARAGQPLYEDGMSLATMQRTPVELLRWLFAAQSFPHGVALLTGTSLVPPGDFTLRDGDVVTVSAAALGTLENPVVTVGARCP